MKETNIQWCDSTVNPTGFQCDGCELWTPIQKRCYAGRWAERIGGKGAFDQPIQLTPGRVAVAAKWPDLRGNIRHGKEWIRPELPRLVFIGDMSDNFCETVPFEYLKREVVDVVAKWAHIGLWLTKRPTRMLLFSRWLKSTGTDWPDNLWPGTSITSRPTLSRINSLLQVGNPWTKKFLSIEPLWESLVGTVVEPAYAKGLEGWLTNVGYCQTGEDEVSPDVEDSYIDWVIVGGESGPNAKPCQVEWIKEIVELCQNASIEGDPVPCFVKQLGSRALTYNANSLDWPDTVHLTGEGDGAAAAAIRFADKKGGDFREWPPELRVRQFPSWGPHAPSRVGFGAPAESIPPL